jgi:hypothetical protein
VAALCVPACVLAGEINRNAENLPEAFANYDETLRPFVNEIQNVGPFFQRLAIPETQWGIAVLPFIAGSLCFLRVPDLFALFSKKEKSGWKLPDCPELKSGH